MKNALSDKSYLRTTISNGFGGALEKNFLNNAICFTENSTSFLINNMSATHTHQKFYSAPTHFFGNTSFS